MPQRLFSSSRAMDGVYRAIVVEPISNDNGLGATLYIPSLHRQQMPFITSSNDVLELLTVDETTGEFEPDTSNNNTRKISMRKQDYPFAVLCSWDAQPTLNTGDVVTIMFENGDSNHPIIVATLGAKLPIDNPLLYNTDYSEGDFQAAAFVDSSSIQAYLNTIGGQPALNWYASSNGSQCTELARDYILKVFKLDKAKTVALGNGKEMYTKVPATFPNVFKSYKYSNTLKLLQGDIISLRGSNTTYGHVGLVKSVNGNSYQLLEQWDGSGTVRTATCNFPGSGNRAVLGVARPIASSYTAGMDAANTATNLI